MTLTSTSCIPLGWRRQPSSETPSSNKWDFQRCAPPASSLTIQDRSRGRNSTSRSTSQTSWLSSSRSSTPNLAQDPPPTNCPNLWVTSQLFLRWGPRHQYPWACNWRRRRTSRSAPRISWGWMPRPWTSTPQKTSKSTRGRPHSPRPRWKGSTSRPVCSESKNKCKCSFLEFRFLIHSVWFCSPVQYSTIDFAEKLKKSQHVHMMGMANKFTFDASKKPKQPGPGSYEGLHNTI